MSGNVVRASFAQPEFEVNVLISELIGFNVDLDLFPFACGVDIFSFEINGGVRSAVGKLYRHAFGRIGYYRSYPDAELIILFAAEESGSDRRSDTVSGCLLVLLIIKSSVRACMGRNVDSGVGRAVGNGRRFISLQKTFGDVVGSGRSVVAVARSLDRSILAGGVRGRGGRRVIEICVREFHRILGYGLALFDLIVIFLSPCGLAFFNVGEVGQRYAVEERPAFGHRVFHLGTVTQREDYRYGLRGDIARFDVNAVFLPCAFGVDSFESRVSRAVHVDIRTALALVVIARGFVDADGLDPYAELVIRGLVQRYA